MYEPQRLLELDVVTRDHAAGEEKLGQVGLLAQSATGFGSSRQFQCLVEAGTVAVSLVIDLEAADQSGSPLGQLGVVGGSRSVGLGGRANRIGQCGVAA